MRPLKSRTSKALAIAAISVLVPFAALAETILFQDDFSNGTGLWDLQPGWQVEEDSGNFVLSGSGHAFASAGTSSWTNYNLRARLKLLTGISAVHVVYRGSDCTRYFLAFSTNDISLLKSPSCGTGTLFATATEVHAPNTWYTVEVKGTGGHLQVYLDDTLKFDITDDDQPLLEGSFAFEALPDAHVHVDDVVITTDEESPSGAWKSTGGPVGGLGYDVRIHPADKSRMFVTDNYAGAIRSDDAGRTWYPSNSGITVRGGTTRDSINIFSLTVDQNSPDIVWAGLYGEGSTFGVFKSTNGGTTWVPKTTGMSLDGEVNMVFRGFTVQTGNSDVVYAQAEIPTLVQGKEFNRVKGRVYKTVDGGESWGLIWAGDNLARYLIIDPTDPSILYLSTGIFDREAYNSDCAANQPGGVGVLKSTDGGATWFAINDGLTDLYVGCLRMHPTNPKVLFAAAGNNACSAPGNTGLFMTTDGGASWTKVIEKSRMTTVNFSPSDPNVVYAGSGGAFYSSQDGGTSWTKLRSEEGGSWGPSGLRAGVPIDVVVDPDDPLVLYANNYGGGVFRSVDGAVTWEVWSQGYSGADIHVLDVPANTNSVVYAIGRTGPFVSLNAGRGWSPVAHGKARSIAEWDSIASSPSDYRTVLVSDEFDGSVFLSTDGGDTYSEVLVHPSADGSDRSKREGFRGLAFAPSNPDVVYAGLSKNRGSFLTSETYGTVLFKSTDGGRTFSDIPSALDGTNVRRFAIHPGNANLVYAATTGGLYRSSDGGANWTRLQALGERQFEAVAIDPSSPNRLYAGEIFGGTWISVNGGESWTGPHNAGFNSPNPYVSSIVVEPASGIVYAADLYSGVYRSTDGGTTWTPFPDWKMSGLAVRAVKDLALSRTALYAATQGGGVFRFDFVEQGGRKRPVRRP